MMILRVMTHNSPFAQFSLAKYQQKTGYYPVMFLGFYQIGHTQQNYSKPYLSSNGLGQGLNPRPAVWTSPYKLHWLPILKNHHHFCRHQSFLLSTLGQLQEFWFTIPICSGPNHGRECPIMITECFWCLIIHCWGSPPLSRLGLTVTILKNIKKEKEFLKLQI